MKKENGGLLILCMLFLGAVPAIAGKAKKPAIPATVPEIVYYDGGTNALASGAWRFSGDGKYYSLALSGGLRITPIGSGALGADIPRKTDKKGHVTMEGLWRVGAFSGLLVIQQIGLASVSGQMLVPTPGAGFSACNSRKSAIFFSVGQPESVCNFISVNWLLESDLSADQLANSEKVQDNVKPGGQSRPPLSVTAPPVISPVVGVWFQDSDGNVSANQKLTITIRPDGTYTKESVMRVPAYGIGNIPSSHNGTWTAQGMVVRLSGDGRYPGSTHDLSTFTRLR